MLISGKEIPIKKKIYIGLTYIKGIGIKKAKKICKKYNLSPNTLVEDLTEGQQDKIKIYIENNYIIENAINKQVNQNIIKYIQNNSRRGFRLRKGLPVRGQRTHSNGRTQKQRTFIYNDNIDKEV